MNAARIPVMGLEVAIGNPHLPSLAIEKNALEFTNVTKRFQRGGRLVEALTDISFSVSAGVITCLIGPDGAGKTTLMRLATGLLIPEKGTIRTLGLDASTESLAVQTAIGYMPQRFGLYEDLTVWENLNLYADLQGLEKQDRASRYMELMEMTGLDPFKSRLAGRLSGGMKQKLGLACTLVRPPRFLLLDEPTVGVDPLSRRELWNIIDRLVQEQGVSVLLSTAYLDEAERCQEVLILQEGKLLGGGKPGEFSQKMEGRTFRISVPGIKNRKVENLLANGKGILDVVIHGDHVRLVTEMPGPPDVHLLGSYSEGASLESVSPRFEDSFVALLKSPRTGSSTIHESRSGVMDPNRKSNAKEAVIEVRGGQRRFGTFFAVKDISFDVYPGEVFGLLGANGAGKSTTFRMLCGLLPPSGGSLKVAGVDLRRSAPAARARIGYMSQKFSLYGNLSVRQNLNFFSGAYGLSGQHRDHRIQWSMKEFDLDPVADTVSSHLPQGYKQRLALACALMHEPEILFLDEPTSGVDPLARREFWSRINTLAEEGVTVLVTTHFMEEANYCDRLVIMAAGRILTMGTPTEIKTQARSPECPRPSIEDAFIKLIETDQSKGEEQ